MRKKIFTFLFALVASVGMMNAKVTWNSSNISDLDVMGTYASYSKEGVTLSANADMIDAMWFDYGDESQSGIEFHANATGGFTFSNSLGKNFTKIEMTLRGPGGWDHANLGSGWSFSWEDYGEEPVFVVTWTGNAKTVDLAKDESSFHGDYVKRIVFYFEGDSEAPNPTYTVALEDGTANADKVTLSKTSAVEGATITVTPNEEYEITAFKATYNTTEELSKSFNAETGAYSFTMPAYDVTIEATIAAKPVPEGDVFAGFTATAGSGGFTNEGHANLVDGKFISAEWTKWCTNNDHRSVPTGESGDACWWIDFEASAALNLTGYILTTGNDTGSEHGRNPKNWVLKAKLNADDAWTTIATVTNDVTMKNLSFKDYKFFVDQQGSYKYFRFEVFANQGATVMQLCELRLIGTEAPAPATTTVTWNSSTLSSIDIDDEGLFIKDGVTLTVLNGIIEGTEGYWSGPSDGTAFKFSTSLGNFTKIEITGDIIVLGGSGWTQTSPGIVWTGDANETTTFGGYFQNVSQIVFTIAEAAPQPAEDVNITPNVDPQNAGVYYSTFYDSANKYALPAGVEAYVAEVSSNALNLTKIAGEGQTIPADNAVILRSSVAGYTLTVSDAAPVTFTATNSLRGVDVATTVTDITGLNTNNCYVLSGGSEDESVTGVGFYLIYGTTLLAHKAYVQYSATSGAPKRMRFVFPQEQMPTGIDETNTADKAQKVMENGTLYIIRDGVRYNATGQVAQ